MPGERWLLAIIVVLGVLAGVLVAGVPERGTDPPLELRVEATTTTLFPTTTRPPTTTSTTSTTVRARRG